MRLLFALAPTALVALPLSCGSSNNGSGTEGDASPDSSGYDAATGTPDTGSGQDATGQPDVARGPEAGTSDATVDGGADGAADAETADAATTETGAGAVGDGSTDGAVEGSADAGPACPTPTDSSMARVCMALTPDPDIAFADAATPALDGMGTLIVLVYAVSDPTDAGDGGPATPIAEIAYPPPNDAGAFTEQVSVYALPPVIPLPFDLPATSLYIVSYFVDNPAWFENQSVLTYGLFVGGLNLTNGVQPPPGIRATSALTAGQGNIVAQHLTVMRRFQTVVAPIPGLTPAAGGDGTGALSAGVFHQATPIGAPIFGGGQYGCVDILHQSPYPLSGFFYISGIGSALTWFGAQLDDFGAGGVAPPGSFISIVDDDAGNQVTPPGQAVTVAASQYSVDMSALPDIALTYVVPGVTGTDALHCPFDGGVPEAGAEGGAEEGGADSGGADSGAADSSSEASTTDASDAGPG